MKHPVSAVGLYSHRGNRTSCRAGRSTGRSSSYTTTTRSTGRVKGGGNKLSTQKLNVTAVNGAGVKPVRRWYLVTCVAEEQPCDLCLVAVNCTQENTPLIIKSHGKKNTSRLLHNFDSPPYKMEVLWTISWASALNSSKFLYFPSDRFWKRDKPTDPWGDQVINRDLSSCWVCFVQ